MKEDTFKISDEIEKGFWRGIGFILANVIVIFFIIMIIDIICKINNTEFPLALSNFLK